MRVPYATLGGSLHHGLCINDGGFSDWEVVQYQFWVTLMIILGEQETPNLGHEF